MGDAYPMRRLWAFIIFTSLAVATLSLWLWWEASTELQHLTFEVERSSDVRFENAAYTEAAHYEVQPIKDIRRLFRPISMTYNQKECVELRPRWGVVGGHTIYCFDLRTGALLSKETVRG